MSSMSRRRSNLGDEYYAVTCKGPGEYECTCRDFAAKGDCRHIQAIRRLPENGLEPKTTVSQSERSKQLSDLILEAERAKKLVDNGLLRCDEILESIRKIKELNPGW